MNVLKRHIFKNKTYGMFNVRKKRNPIYMETLERTKNNVAGLVGRRKTPSTSALSYFEREA